MQFFICLHQLPSETEMHILHHSDVAEFYLQIIHLDFVVNVLREKIFHLQLALELMIKN